MNLISIVSAPRKAGVSYLETTAKALLREGGWNCNRVIVTDGDYSPSVENWVTHNHGDRYGVIGAMWGVYEYFLSTHCENLIYCEDDILPCINAVSYIDGYSVPKDCAFVDFRDTYYGITDLKKKTFVESLPRPTTRYYWGNYCQLLPRRTVEYLVNCNPWEVALPWDRKLGSSADAVLGELVAKSPWPRYQIHVPRLVTHKGEFSVAWPEKPFNGRRGTVPWAGFDFDALKLRKT